ncbi:hypothetical protein CDN99_11080 [Roseateles aquatilis]|uniref:Uncharacterized protein n=1 Tax=Roseateles aquatilis TaxID=431061 RepID=A0A246JDZ0_9BURK|nr:hypothetical protein [Roseateles aquatilis]OWQ90717.1 hypothetical protein CDN99_11080 [Roseateles aquatilis]
MDATTLKQTLWRVVYTKSANLNSGGDCAGPWHPDKAHIEQCAANLRALSQRVGIQSNAQAATNASTWIKERT